MKNNFYLRYIFYRFILFKKAKKKPVIKAITENWNTMLWKQRFSLFEINLNKTMGILSHTRSPDTIVKSFDYILKLVQNLQLYKPWWVSKQVYLFDYDIMILSNIKIIKDTYIKVFLTQRIDNEIKKSSQLETKWLKEKYIKKAIDMALNAVEYLPDDQEMLCRVAELESLLIGGETNDK